MATMKLSNVVFVLLGMVLLNALMYALLQMRSTALDDVTAKVLAVENDFHSVIASALASNKDLQLENLNLKTELKQLTDILSAGGNLADVDLSKLKGFGGGDDGDGGDGGDDGEMCAWPPPEPEAAETSCEECEPCDPSTVCGTGGTGMTTKYGGVALRNSSSSDNYAVDAERGGGGGACKPCVCPNKNDRQVHDCPPTCEELLAGTGGEVDLDNADSLKLLLLQKNSMVTVLQRKTATLTDQLTDLTERKRKLSAEFEKKKSRIKEVIAERDALQAMVKDKVGGGYAPSEPQPVAWLPTDVAIDSQTSLDKVLTIGIKTISREAFVARCISSIRRFYPSLQVLVANDGRTRLDMLADLLDEREMRNVRVAELDYDVGLSEGRNILVEATSTKYFMLLDDDFVFQEHTAVLSRVVALMQRANLDIVGAHYAGQRPFTGWFNLDGRVLQECIDHARYAVEMGSQCYLTDRVDNCFVARTDFLAKNKWEKKLKVKEHTDYFYRIWKKRADFAKKMLMGKTKKELPGRIAVCPWFSVDHRRAMADVGDNEEYAAMRSREVEYKNMMLQMRNLDNVRVKSCNHIPSLNFEWELEDDGVV